MDSNDPEMIVLPKPFQKFFPENFNKIQKQSFHDIWNTEYNLVVQAPTGSGKTVLAKLAFLKALLKPGKGIYVGPLRALNDEKAKEFQEFANYEWNVKTVLGGSYNSPKELESIDLLLTTPEKLLSLLYTLDLSSFSTIVIDEVHLLGEQKRGAYLEFVIMELQRKYPAIRIVALSATIPNTLELSSWLQATPLIFGQEYRSTKLVVKVISVEKNSSHLAKLVKGYQITKKFLPEQILLFSTSRANVQYYAKKMSEWLSRDSTTSQNVETQETITYSNKCLTEFSSKGIAFYHAGLSENDKKFIIQNFLDQRIKILITTSSLAWGINLPAKAVIIMDIEYSNPLIGKEPMSSADILQMLGRAGRPQFHTKGYGYILTNENQNQKIENMLEGKNPIVSSMNEFLLELVLHFLALEKASAFSKEELFEFFSKSFMIYTNFFQKDELEEELEKILSSLEMYKLIESSSESITITKYGSITSRFFINPITTGNLLNIKPNKVDEILPYLTEFQELPVRKSEKKFLRSLGATPKTYQSFKLKYVIEAMEHEELLEPEFIQDGKVIYNEYLRIQSFYNFIKKI